MGAEHFPQLMRQDNAVTVVFVNYRVREQPGYASLLHRELAQRFGAERVFCAAQSIHAGDDFVDEVFATLRGCEVLLALIGPSWADLLGDPADDWVYREIETAFAADIRVIPVLLDDAEMPAPERLPAGIAALARCQGVRLRHYSTDSDLARLIEELHRAAPSLRLPSSRLPAQAAGFRLVGPDAPSSRLAIVPGMMRRVHTADMWINSENTDMRMARHNEFSVSAIIRYWGAVRDMTGRVVDDVVADELEATVGATRPVAPGAVVVTGAGELAKSHGVRHIIHVATVQGEPGAGYRQVRNIGWCVTNALQHAERLAPGLSRRSVLFPMFGTGVAGGDVEATADAMVAAAVDYVLLCPGTLLRRILFLGHDERQYRALHTVLRALPVVPE
jgi:O-acetyl-ADP-ribose deacetylase (regulator of RNase III)